MKKLGLLTIIPLLLLSQAVIAEVTSLTLGVFPYVSSAKLVKHQSPLTNYLNSSEELSISLTSAKNFPTYVKNLKNFQYDLIFSAPHIARYMEKHFNYQRVAMTTNKIRGIYIVLKDSKIFSLKDLKNTTLSTTSAKAIVHQMVLKQLQAQGINTKTDITIKTVKTFNNAIHDVLNKDSDVAVTGIKLWKHLRPERKSKLRKLALTDATSGFIVLAKPSIAPQTIKTLQKQFLKFNETEMVKRYIFKGFKLIDDTVMESLDFHAKVFE